MRAEKRIGVVLAAVVCGAGWAGPLARAANTGSSSSAPQTKAPASQSDAQATGDRMQQVTQQRIQSEASEASQRPDVQPVAEALSAVQQTQDAVHLLDQNQPDKAKAALVQALGKTDTLLANHPNLALIPLQSEARLSDTSADDATLKQTGNEIKGLVAQGQFQAARPLLRNFASEIDIDIVSLPIATYPNAIREASKLIDQGKIPEAKASLLAALRTLVVAEKAIPLPIIRAQALVDDVSSQADQKKLDKAQADRFLSQASQQLSLAETLGYGTKDDFADLQNSIADAKHKVDQSQQPQSVLAHLKSGLKSLHDKLSKAASQIT